MLHLYGRAAGATHVLRRWQREGSLTSCMQHVSLHSHAHAARSAVQRQSCPQSC